MANLYLVGGAPRVGKGKILKAFVQQKPMQAFSTDVIRDVLRSTKIDPVFKPSPGFPVRDYQEVLDMEIAEAKATWHFLQPFCEDVLKHQEQADTFIEGIGILPELVSQLKNESKTVFVGNTINKEILTEISENNPTDWLHNLPQHKSEHFKGYFIFASQYYKSEAAKYGFEYIEMQDGKFEDNVQKVVNKLVT